MDDHDLCQWVENDEGLYDLWRASRQSLDAFIRTNRKFIDEVIANIRSGRKPAHYLKYVGRPLMPKWNMFSDEVAEERRVVRAYGVAKIMNAVREPDSYKGQALRQLAMRLELEAKVEELQAEIVRLQDREEKLEFELRNAQEQLDVGEIHAPPNRET